MKEKCDTCLGSFLYEQAGVTYSREVAVEVPGVYDGALLMMCPWCMTYRNRFDPGDRLFDVAEGELVKIRATQLDYL